jgi:acyl carrier protein
MDRIEIEKTVLKLLVDVLKQPLKEGAEITCQNTPAWDSLKHIEIMFALEDEFSVEFTEDELVKLDSNIKIVSSLLAKYAS